MRDPRCNADLGHSCDGNDGDPCASCEADAAYWRQQWERSAPCERLSDAELRAQLVDAGRIS